MELIEALRTTGAVRAFTDEVVDDATLAAVLDNARFAPSGANAQPGMWLWSRIPRSVRTQPLVDRDGGWRVQAATRPLLDEGAKYV